MNWRASGRQQLADAHDGSGTPMILRCIDLLVAERGRMSDLVFRFSGTEVARPLERPVWHHDV